MTERTSSCTPPAPSAFLRPPRSRKQLIERAVALEMPAMALLDHNGVYGSARFHTSGKRNGMRAHIGAEISVSQLRNAADAAGMAAAPASSTNRRGCRCSAHRARAIRISASSSRSSRCARRRRARARRPSTIWANMPAGWSA